MRSRLLIFWLAFSCTGGVRADLVGFWPLDGNAIDESCNGNDGAISGNVTPIADRLGRPGRAMLFGGAQGDRIDLEDRPEFQITGPMTLAAWVLLKSGNPNNGRIVAKAGGSGQRAWSLNIELDVSGVANPATFQIASTGSSNVSVRDTQPLPVGEWVHMAGVYRPGEATEVYVNGELRNIITTGIPVQQFSNNGLSVLIGNRHAASNCGWYGAIDELRIYNEALSETEIRAIMGVCSASNPIPADEAVGVDPNIVLQWDAPASGACSIYFGTNPDFAGQHPAAVSESGTYDPGGNLQFATHYYWRVDLQHDGQTYEGPIWNFTTKGLAYNPLPADGAARVGTEGTLLRWTGDDAATSYDVYLGRDFDAAASASRPAAKIDGFGTVGVQDLKVLCGQWLTCPVGLPNANLDGAGNVDMSDFGIMACDWGGPFQGNQTSATFDPGTLMPDTVYYWRVDEANDAEPTSPWKGNLWSFKTGSGARLWEYEEWAVSNPSWEGNPFDVVAEVTFTHTESGDTRTTQMYYDGGNTWKFRFTGTKTGQWRYASTSADPELHGLEGAVAVAPNQDSRKAGFVIAQGQKWARSATCEVFVPQFVMYRSVSYFAGRPDMIDADIETFLEGHGFTGFHVCMDCRWFDIERSRYDEISTPDPNPDARTFAALEMLIEKTYAAGGTVHIWAWGDEQRKLTPIKWGINGTVDRRLQRYIAARLGPLPGWTMGYGFDLWEWVTGAQLSVWHEYMHSHFGWAHLLGARSEKNQLTQLCETLDYASYEQHRPGYAMYVQTIEARPDKPSFSEDRFRIREDSAYPEKDYDAEMTRMGLWHSTMAGGVANIWGNLAAGSSSSAPYPNAEQIRCWRTFFEGRFLPDMVRDNSLTDGVCLRSAGGQSWVFYKEDTVSIDMNLSAAVAPLKAVAVDTKINYTEIDLWVLEAARQTWTAPYVSDWAISVGDFDEK